MSDLYARHSVAAMKRVVFGPMLLAVLFAGPAGAQTPQVRFAAATDCPVNIGCIPGFKRVYGIDPTSVYKPLAVADAGIQALDDGTAEVALAFSSNPQLSRPDIEPLIDDKHMIRSDHVVPIIRTKVLKHYGKPLRRRLDAMSAVLSTLELRGLNQQVIDDRLPEAVGGEFADANGLGGPAPRRMRGPVIRIGYQAFDENETLAYMYAEALRGAGFRVRVRALNGVRPAAVKAMRTNRIDMWPAYTGSLLGYLGGKSLNHAVARIGATTTRRSPAQDRNGFAMKRDVAARLGIHTFSDLAKYWPPVSSTARASQADGEAIGAESVDPLLSEQWAFNSDSLLDLPAAWDLTRGAGITVAIVDSGVKLDHADLAPNIWTNFGEVPGNGVDDDHNGYVDDVHGVDLSSKSPAQDLHDGLGHGTHVAGIVAAARNGRGVVGVAPEAKLMVVKVLSDDGGGTTGAVAEGIRYAAANGAKIINLSLGGDNPDPNMDAAIKAAADAGVLVVASAGNSGRDIDSKPSYPAAIPASNLVAVASTDPDNGRGISDYSNYGRLTVQVAAPGGQILSTSNSGGWEIKSGTSMAAPMVAGVAALAASVNPSISAVDLRAILTNSATRAKLPVASGYVNALQAVMAASTASGATVTVAPRLQILDATRKGAGVTIQASVSGSTAAIAKYKVVLGGRTYTLEPRPSPLTIKVRSRGSRVRIIGISATGSTLTTAQQKVKRLRSGKGGVGTGSGVGA